MYGMHASGVGTRIVLLSRTYGHIRSTWLRRFILDLIRCRDWCGSDDGCILNSRDDICDIIKFLAAGLIIVV